MASQLFKLARKASAVEDEVTRQNGINQELYSRQRDNKKGRTQKQCKGNSGVMAGFTPGNSSP